MPTSDFLLYASAATNIVSQATYAGDTNTTNGRSSGIWPSANMNKMMRQASYASAAIGSLINTYANQNATDNGNLSTFTASFLLALQNIALTVARTVLKADTTFYVATTGNDVTGTGLTVGSPWATIQHAYTTIQNTYDLNGFKVTIQLANGTYNQALSAGGILIGQNTPNDCIINGNSGTPSLVVINGGAATSLLANAGAQIVVQNLQVQGLTGLSANGSGSILNFKNIVFAACTASHIFAVNQGQMQAIGNYSITGNAAAHVNLAQLAYVDLSNASVGIVITVSASLTFSTAFAQAYNNAVLITTNTTFSTNVATGVRYNVTRNATIDTGAAGPTYFPGGTGGTATNNGVYD